MSGADEEWKQWADGSEEDLEWEEGGSQMWPGTWENSRGREGGSVEVESCIEKLGLEGARSGGTNA